MDLEFIEKLRLYTMAILVAVLASFGGVLFGYEIGIISGLLDMQNFLKTFGHIQSDGTYELAARDKSLIVAMLPAGTFFGALLGYPFADFIGRRWGLILACLIFPVGVAFQTASTQLSLFIAGRAIDGIGLGIVSCIAPMYVAECAPKAIRGAMVSVYQWFIAMGVLSASLINNATKDMNSNACYQIPICIQLIWTFILAIGMLILPESPRYLVLKNRIDQAHKSQARLVSHQPDDSQVKADINELIINTEAAKAHGSSTFLDCFRLGPQKNLYRTLAGISLQAWQQLSGINFIFYYGTTFFSSSGIANPFMSTILIDIVNVIMTVVGVLIIDKLGRRNILIIGSLGMSLSQFIIAIVGTGIGQPNSTVQYILVIFNCIYIGIFAASWGPTPWVVTSELYPTPIRAKCMSLSIASSWLFNFLIAYVSPYLIDPGEGNLGIQIFYVWGSTCLGCFVFSMFCIWETKGLSLEQVDYLIQNSTPFTSPKLNKQLKQGIVIDNTIIDPSNFPMTSRDGTIEKPDISTDPDNSNEKTSLLGKIQ